jgi:SNF2 family DNA or RNA helicase
MLKTRNLTIHVKKNNDTTFFLWGEHENGKVAPPDEWIKHLFIWHEESYYGTTVTTINSDQVNGIKVASWELVTLFSKESFSHLIDWSWDDTAQHCFALSPILHDSILSGNWIPKFDVLTDRGMSFQVPDEVWDNFNNEFWSESIDTGESLQTFVNNWFQSAIHQFLGSNESNETFKKLQKLQNSSLTSEELHQYFDEEHWRKWTGLEESPVPFSVGLRITEPQDDDEPWKLETILRDKKSSSYYSLQGDTIPPTWNKHLSAVKDEQMRLMKMMPFFKDVDGSFRTSLNENDAWDFLTVLSEKLVDLDIDVYLPTWWQAMKDAQLTVKAKVKSHDTSYRPSFVGLNAMLDFDWRLTMNGAELSEEDFQRLVDEQRRLVKIRGQWMKLDPAMVRRMQALMSQAKEEGLSLRDLLEQELTPPTEEEQDGSDEDQDPFSYIKIQIELNRSLKKFIHQLTNLSEIPMKPTPDGFIGELRPYQLQGMSWMLFLRKYGFGGCLADDMGLGKTIQLITYLLHVKKQEKPKQPALIIAPTSVLGNWQREIEKFAPDLTVALHYGANRSKGDRFEKAYKGADIVLTSYGLSHIDFDDLSEVTWSTIALDEAQNIKNANTKQSRAIRKLQGQHHLALTGTPMENRLSELWAIFDFLNHGYLGGFTQFQKNFILPIEKEETQHKVKELQAKIRPFLLRRTKKDPEVELNLPDKIEQKEYCALTSEQASLYEQLIMDTFEKIEELSGFERKGLVLQMLNKLKQLCNHPALYLKEPEPANIALRSEKMKKLLEIMNTVTTENEACLIFTQYISMGEMIQQVIGEQFGIEVPFLNGSMPKQKRDELVDKFQAGEFPVFLLSLKAGGTGLNLTAANHVIHYDRWWNPAVENQATDRAYRIGQKRFVHVHKLIASGTLEEKIDAMLEKKQALNDEIIQSDQWLTELSNQDLHHLLTLE